MNNTYLTQPSYQNMVYATLFHHLSEFQDSLKISKYSRLTKISGTRKLWITDFFDLEIFGK